MLRTEQGYHFEAGDRGCGVLAQDIDRAALVRVDTHRVGEHGKTEMTAVPRCDCLQGSEVLLLKDIDACSHLRDSRRCTRCDEQCHGEQLHSCSPEIRARGRAAMLDRRVTQ